MKHLARNVPRALAPALLAAALFAAAPARGQTFAVGGGLFAVNDVGSAAITRGFSTWGGSLFGEMTLDKHVTLQLRGARFAVRGSGSDAPNIDITAATLTCSYLFDEDWFKAGLMAGLGGYFLRPQSPGPGQGVVDVSEDAFGWTGGLVTIFEVGQKFDIRVQALGHLIRTSAARKPIEIGLAAAYHF
jgi:hypothetical protein